MGEIDEIVQEFLVESSENLDQLDRDLVALEQDPTSRDLLSSVFRTIHTIKGTCGFLGFGHLERLTHVAENLLAKLRDGALVLTPPTTSLLLETMDAVRSMMDAIEATGSEGDEEYPDLVARLGAALTGEPAPEAPVAEAPVAEAPVAEAPAAEAPVAEAPAEPTDDSSAVDADDDENEEAAVAEPILEQAAATPLPAHATTSPATATPAAAAPAGGEVKRASETTVRVDVEVLDSLMRLVGELVLTRNQVLQHVTAGVHDLALARMLQRLNGVTSELQEGVMKARMQPVDGIFSKFPRVVRDLATQCGKQVNLVLTGRDTELDRTLLEAIKDPLTHLVRNGVDHGIEDPADRVAAGKTAVGTLELRAFHEGGRVVIEIVDDGGGIDAAKVGAKAVAKGLITQSQLDAMSTRDVLGLIFRPGFSTAEKVTNVSGRGVGMDVVKTNIEKIGGTVEVDSTVGAGTVCRLTLPLTLAIVSALTVEVSGQRFVLPQVNVAELVAVPAEKAASLIENVGGSPVHRLRGRLLPLVHATKVLGLPAVTEPRDAVIVVVQTDGRSFGLLVDRVLNSEEIVVSALGSRLSSAEVFSGATILGDGGVALILDAQAVSAEALVGDAAEQARTEQSASDVVTADDRFLVAAVSEQRKVAIPLSEVTRLEEFAADAVEQVGARDVVRYRGQIMPLLHLPLYLGAGAPNPDRHAVVVFTSPTGRTVGLTVIDILDVVEGGAGARTDATDAGLLGGIEVGEQVIELLDTTAVLQAADPKFLLADASANTWEVAA